MRISHDLREQAKILVVDDNQTISLTFSAILETQGYKVATAFSGEEAVIRAAGFSPDLLLSDINMSPMTGIEAAARITAMVPECKVLFLSGHASMSDIAEAAPEHLIYNFTSKPLHPLDLLNVVEYMLPVRKRGGGGVTAKAKPASVTCTSSQWN